MELTEQERERLEKARYDAGKAIDLLWKVRDQLDRKLLDDSDEEVSYEEIQALIKQAMHRGLEHGRAN